MDLLCHHIDVTFLYTDLTDNTSFDKVKFWVDQLKAAEPVSCLKWWPGLAQIKLAITHASIMCSLLGLQDLSLWN